MVISVERRTPTKLTNQMQTAKKEIEFQIWQLSRAIAGDWSNATPEAANHLKKMISRLNKYKAMLPFAR